MKTIFTTLILIAAGCTLAVAQQRSTYNLYRENWMLLNPASFSEDYLIQSKTQSLAVTGRYQWTGLEDAPQTVGLQYQQVLEAQRIAVGGSLLNDQTGAIGSTELFVNTAYQLVLDRRKNQFLSLGLGAGIVQYRVNFSEITFQEPTAALPADNQLLYYPDFSLGAFYYLDNTFFAGLSVPQVFHLNTQGKDGFRAERTPHYMAMAGGYIPLRASRGFSYLEPSAMLKAAPGLPLNLDVNLRYNHQNAFWIGTGYNLAAGIHLETGYYLAPGGADNRLRLGLGYTARSDALRDALGNTFELHASYSWGKSGLVRCPGW
ncbi:MAG: PorP/SprF family type IX secretion system membrane protein [Lewinellaceae bacterium]|nr:PorP/SprF family type IX secretion system membrane protein [Lewinellaceae bacterium]